MAYNYEYPYTDPHRYNSDWVIHEVAELEKAAKIFPVVVGDPIPENLPIGSIVVKYTDQTKTALSSVSVKCQGSFVNIWSS